MRDNIICIDAFALEQVNIEMEESNKRRQELSKIQQELYEWEDQREIELMQIYNFELLPADVIEVYVPGKVESVDEKFSTLASSLRYVGIKAINCETIDQFFPHGRDFFLLPEMGEFKYKGEIVENWYMPTIGAERLPTSRVASLGIDSESGVVSLNPVADIIHCAREKLDGFEAITYTIRTRNYLQSFFWSHKEHKPIDKIGEGHYEIVGNDLYHLSGDNVMNGIPHFWLYLTEISFRDFMRKEGMIVYMSGKEYRVPVILNATLRCKGGIATDLSGTMRVECGKNLVGNYDFNYDKKKFSWTMSKFRPDKNKPDHVNSINVMISSTATMEDLVNKILIPKGLRIPFPTVAKVIAFGGSIERKIAALDDRLVGSSLQKKFFSHGRAEYDDGSTAVGMFNKVIVVRESGTHKKDSYRGMFLKQFNGKCVNLISDVVKCKNQILVSGRAVKMRRSLPITFKYLGRVYTTDFKYSRGHVIYFSLRKEREESVLLEGNHVIRAYEVDYNLMGTTIRDEVGAIVVKTRPKFYYDSDDDLPNESNLRGCPATIGVSEIVDSK